MIRFTTTRRCAVKRTARLSQVEGMFDVPPSLVSEKTWDVTLDLPEQWNVAVIVGPSMAGKTTVAAALAQHLGTKITTGFDWPADKCIVDGFPAGAGGMSVKEITGLLSSVGFSSPPDWRKPFAALSNGGQFRVNLARALAECSHRDTETQRKNAEKKHGENSSASVLGVSAPLRLNSPVCIIDEFTSVVDRTVARIGSAAVAKAVRRRGGRFIAVTCHYDVIDWLEPDWVYEPATNKLTLNQATKCAEGEQRRPFGTGHRFSSKSFGRIPQLGIASRSITI